MYYYVIENKFHYIEETPKFYVEPSKLPEMLFELKLGPGKIIVECFETQPAANAHVRKLKEKA